MISDQMVQTGLQSRNLQLHFIFYHITLRFEQATWLPHPSPSQHARRGPTGAHLPGSWVTACPMGPLLPSHSGVERSPPSIKLLSPCLHPLISPPDPKLRPPGRPTPVPPGGQRSPSIPSGGAGQASSAAPAAHLEPAAAARRGPGGVPEGSRRGPGGLPTLPSVLGASEAGREGGGTASSAGASPHDGAIM